MKFEVSCNGIGPRILLLDNCFGYGSYPITIASPYPTSFFFKLCVRAECQLETINMHVRRRHDIHIAGSGPAFCFWVIILGMMIIQTSF